MRTTVHVPWSDDVRYLRTGDLLVDLCYRRVTRGTTEIELPQRIYELLLLFLAEPGVLHTRTELFERLWAGVIVEDANLSQSIWLLRKALGEDCKHWVRTVAKGGYVFDPPEATEYLTEWPGPDLTRETPVEEADITAPSGSEIDAGYRREEESLPPTPPGTPSVAAPALLRWAQPRHWRRWAMAVMAVALAIVVGTFWMNSGTEADAITTPTVQAAAAPSAVALIEVHDPAVATHWPVTLFHQWLGWKLDALPTVTLLSEADIAAGAGSTAPLVVFLASGSVPEKPGHVMLQARFKHGGRAQRLERKGPASTVPAMVDDLSREVMSQLLPNHAEPWPTLTLDASAANRYADGVEAFKRRDWIAAAAIFNEVVEQAPRFGLVRQQLAHAQARLAQGPSAIAHMEVARDLLQPAPAEVVAVLDAQRLAVDPHRTQAAAEAYGQLARQYPDKSNYALIYATLRVKTGEPELALDALTARDWEQRPTETRISELLLRSHVRQALGESKRAGELARTAEHLARKAGSGWELERAGALLQMANAGYLTASPEERTELYEQAAKLMEKAGNQTGALYARFLVETAGPPTDGSTPRLDKLLAKANAGGYRRLEMEILIRVAAQHHRVGDLEGYRTRLWQALAVAIASGDTTRHSQLGVLLLNEDTLLGHFAQAEERLKRLQSAGLGGNTALMLDQYEALLHYIHGHHELARQTLDRTERRIAKDDQNGTISEPLARLACSRAEFLLSLGDLTGARTDWQRCRRSVSPTHQVVAALGRAKTELLAGDKTQARNLLQPVRKSLTTLSDDSDRWMLTMELARLLTRVGDTDDSDRLYNALLPKLERSGYRALTWAAETGLAENAAARGDWSSSLAHVAEVRRELPADDWMLNQRLRLIDTAAAWAKGDRQRAASLAAQIHARASHLGDAIVQMEVHSLLPDESMPDDCDQAHRDLLIARSGMRGASLDWLTPTFAKSNLQLVGAAKQPLH